MSASAMHHDSASPSLPREFSLDVQMMNQRVRYSEPRRAAHIRLDGGSNGTWWLWPDTFTWWERLDRERPDHADIIREPVQEHERFPIMRRVMDELRSKHGLWVNIAGLTDDPPPPTWQAPPTRVEVDPELAFMLEMEAAAAQPPASASSRSSAIDDPTLLADIDAAIERIQPLADAGWEQAQSILRQLTWCAAAVRGEPVETPPGPFSMGLIATREFDMYGSQPDLASLINRIQDRMTSRGYPQRHR